MCLLQARRGARLRCSFCKAKLATVGCARAQCKKTYHLRCGIENGALQQHFGQFKSFCAKHRPRFDIENIALLEQRMPECP